jgi:thiol-disulfide isomerase/thioredoxin
MIKKLLLVCTLIMSAAAANCQHIPRWKIEEVVRSYSAMNDTVYVINFWATFCKPCNEEIPDFIRLAEKYKKQKVKLLLVSLDLPSYVPVRLPEFIKKNKYKTNHVWLNETDADRFCPMIDANWSGAIPATVIVNNKTGYRKFVEDQMSAVDFEAAIKTAISGVAMKKYTAPMNDAEVVKYPQGGSTTENSFLIFKSKDSSVFAIVGGKVTIVARIDNMKVVIIQKDDLYYTYSNLNSTVVKKGDEVRPDQIIGFAAYDLDGYKPSTELYISNSEKDIMLAKADFLIRKDKRLTDHSIDVDEPK